MVSADAHKEHEYGPAPGDLELVREFVNTNDFDDGTEHLTSPAALAVWLTEHGLNAGTELSQEDLERAIEVREAFRNLLLANTGEPLASDAPAELAAAAERGSVRMEVDAAGNLTARPTMDGVDGLVARLLAAAWRAQVEGTWHRLKACPDETCAWAFYDESRNASRTWCSMGVCGNRAKTRAYRRRKRERQSAD